MSGPRVSGMLPTIKCSTCGNQVEISMMGEHVCSGVGPATDPMPSLETLDTFRPFNKAIHEKVGKVPPLDTNAANRLYMRQQGNLAPLSTSSGARSVSPRTPGIRPGTGRPEDDSTSPHQRRPGGYGGFGDSEGPEADMAYSASPRTPGFLTRNLAPNPFDKKRPGPTEMEANELRSPFSVSERRPSTSQSNASFGGGSMVPPRMPRKNGYGGNGPPERSQSHDDFAPKTIGVMNRSETFPKLSISKESPARTPSAPGSKPDGMRRPSAVAMGPDTSRPPPPRTSVVRPRTAGRDAGSNGPSINLAAEFGIGNPYHMQASNLQSDHTPSDSLSSSYSGSSRPSDPSSRSSPSRSLDSRRNASDASSIDNLMADLQSSIEELKPHELSSATEKPRSASNSSSTRPDLRDDPAVQPAVSPLSRSPLSAPGSERDDPAIQRGSQLNLRAERPMASTPLSPAFPPSPTDRTPSAPASRGYCKACSQAITGKAISSADGRLTGRYHKACFVCTTCSEPFASSTFYVLDDRPYCERHYHKLNNSLCGGCSGGIEGQYLADEREKKYHPGCFRCPDCAVVLRDDYFEVNGAAYCEADAWRRVQVAAPPPPLPQLQAWPNVGPGRPGPPGRGPPMGPKIPVFMRPGYQGPKSGGGPGMMFGGPGFRAPGPYGLPSGGSRLAPSQPRPRMEKRMTRLGIM